jgi:hypothetical protein
MWVAISTEAIGAQRVDDDHEHVGGTGSPARDAGKNEKNDQRHT